jgi:hypothetical protein
MNMKGTLRLRPRMNTPRGAKGTSQMTPTGNIYMYAFVCICIHLFMYIYIQIYLCTNTCALIFIDTQDRNW